MNTATSQGRFQTIFGGRQAKKADKNIFGKKVGLVTKLFGCWHENLSRPFSHSGSAYRSCLKCGAIKQFDTQTLQTYGAFYFPPPVKKEERV